MNFRSQPQPVGLSAMGATGPDWVDIEHTKAKEKFRPRESNPRDTCNYCKEEGHWKFNCPKLEKKVKRSHVLREKQLKLDNVLAYASWSRKLAKKGIFMGYVNKVKGYRIWSPSQRRVILSRDATFKEDYLFRVKQDSVEPSLRRRFSKRWSDDRPHRNAKAPSRFGFEDYVAYALQVAEEVESLEPATYREVITSKESHMRSAVIVKR
ncbi:retrovirus-related pol polyprotein from transposon TNT 1-94 [Tanacetum coccineum]